MAPSHGLGTGGLHDMTHLRVRTWILIVVLVTLIVVFGLYALARTTRTGGGSGTPVPVSQRVNIPAHSPGMSSVD